MEFILAIIIIYLIGSAFEQVNGITESLPMGIMLRVGIVIFGVIVLYAMNIIKISPIQ
jgi:xanthine/uracil permease